MDGYWILSDLERIANPEEYYSTIIHAEKKYCAEKIVYSTV
jgi:hypothetical protein